MAKVPIEAQVLAVQRLAEKGRDPALLAAVASLRMIQANADALRALIQHLRLPSEEDRARLVQHPAVQELLRHFPEAQLSAIEPVRLAAPDHETEETET